MPCNPTKYRLIENAEHAARGVRVATAHDNDYNIIAMTDQRADCGGRHRLAWPYRDCRGHGNSAVEFEAQEQSFALQEVDQKILRKRSCHEVPQDGARQNLPC